MHSLQDYTFTLPEHLIAQELASPPDECKLLVYKKNNNTYNDHIFSSLPELLPAKSLLVFNKSKVVKARIQLDHIPERENQEILFLRALDEYTFEALVWPGKKYKPGSSIVYNDEITFFIESISPDGRIIRCNRPIFEVLEQIGSMALPAYITYEKVKEKDYQPLFASTPGSVAAPTASLHFTDRLLKKLDKVSIETTETTLHIGLGTFKPMDVENVTMHNIHAETIILEQSLFAKIAQKKGVEEKVIAVGTTTTRTMETMPYAWGLLSPEEKKLFDQATNDRRDNATKNITKQHSENVIKSIHYSNNGSRTVSSKLYIYPGFTFRIIDGLITNFHTPKSTLLVLIASFIGVDAMKNLYEYAIKQEYKFYSFGDVSLLIP